MRRSPRCARKVEKRRRFHRSPLRRRPTIAASRRALDRKREHSIPGGTILPQTIKQVFLTRRTKGGRPSTPKRQVLALRAVHDHIPARSARILAFPCLGRPPFFPPC